MKFVSKQVLVDDGGYGDFQEKEVQQQPAPVSKVTNQWSGDASLSTPTAVDDDDGAELAPAGEAACCCHWAAIQRENEPPHGLFQVRWQVGVSAARSGRSRTRSTTPKNIPRCSALHHLRAHNTPSKRSIQAQHPLPPSTCIAPQHMHTYAHICCLTQSA